MGDAKADVDLQIEVEDVQPDTGYYRGTPLGYAINKGNEDLCKLLIEKQASVNTDVQEIIVMEVHRTESCLNCAIDRGHMNICKLLLAARADPQGTFEQNTTHRFKGARGKGSA